MKFRLGMFSLYSALRMMPRITGVNLHTPHAYIRRALELKARCVSFGRVKQAPPAWLRTDSQRFSFLHQRCQRKP